MQTSPARSLRTAGARPAIGHALLAALALLTLSAAPLATGTGAAAAPAAALPESMLGETSTVSGAFAAPSAMTGSSSDDRPSKVEVPSEYVYDPKLGALHDYCTAAPDEFPAPKAENADFRGPCARHDLCYAGSTSEKTCDKALRGNMFQNCEHYYGRYTPLRTACKATAVVYWAAVVAT